MEERILKWWKSDYWFLDNSYQTPITFQNITYPSVTHAMMGAQTEQLMMRVKISQSPLQSLKRLSEEIGEPYEGFEGANTMRKLLEYKFGRDSEQSITPYQADLAQKLIVTGNKTLVYGNMSCSMFWGDCDCPNHFKDKGKNVLGGLLMGIREKLIDYVVKGVNLKQVCPCGKPNEAFYMYARLSNLWLRPFCSDCQAKIGVEIAKACEGAVRRFEKEWVKEPKPVNKIILPNNHLRPEIFNMRQNQMQFDEAKWEEGWHGHFKQLPVPQVVEPKLPQNITFHLSGRIT